MRHIDGLYTQYFNRKYHLDGQLFRGRYKSVLIEDDSHLLEVLRYVQRNPLKAGYEKNLGEYPWYSYLGYLSDSSEWRWLYADFILSMFDGSQSEKKSHYKEFMTKESSREVQAIFSGGKYPAIFGSEGFREKIKKLFSKGKIEEEIPESKVLVPEVEEIVQKVCDYYQISRDELLISRRGVVNEPRNMAVFLIRGLRGERLLTMADHFRMGKYSSVSSIVTRFQHQLEEDNELRKKRDEILTSLIGKMSQAKT
jgi:hypothetical protein